MERILRRGYGRKHGMEVAYTHVQKSLLAYHIHISHNFKIGKVENAILDTENK